MFYLRLNKITIKKNRDLIGKAEIQLMSFVTSGESDFPMLNDFFETNDLQTKQNIIKQAVQQVIASRIMPEIKKIKDKESITFGDTGYILYKSTSTPQDFSWILMAVDSDKKTRTDADIAASVLTPNNINIFTSKIAELAGIVNPMAAAASTLFNLTTDVIAKIYKNKHDDQIGLFMTSFIKEVDYPDGKKTGQNIADTTDNMFIDYTIVTT